MDFHPLPGDGLTPWASPERCFTFQPQISGTLRCTEPTPHPGRDSPARGRAAARRRHHPVLKKKKINRGAKRDWWKKKVTGRLRAPAHRAGVWRGCRSLSLPALTTLPRSPPPPAFLTHPPPPPPRKSIAALWGSLSPYPQLCHPHPETTGSAASWENRKHHPNLLLPHYSFSPPDTSSRRSATSRSTKGRC